MAEVGDAQELAGNMNVHIQDKIVDSELINKMDDLIGTIEDSNNQIQELGDTISSSNDELLISLGAVSSYLAKIDNTLNVIAMSISENTTAIKNFKISGMARIESTPPIKNK